MKIKEDKNERFLSKVNSELEKGSDFFGGKPMGTLQKSFYCKGVEAATEIVNKIANECRETTISYKQELITDFLQYVRDNADKFGDDVNRGWSLENLISLSLDYCDEKNKEAQCERKQRKALNWRT